MTQDELLHIAQMRGLTRKQVVALLSMFIDNNEQYLARRRKRHKLGTSTDELLDEVQPALAMAIQLLRDDRPQE